MKQLFFLCSIVITCFAANAQERFYAYKSDWSVTGDLKEAQFFMQVLKENDSVFVCRYYHISGPMIRMETFRDEQLTIPMGRFAWYNERGKIDSTGFVYNGKKDGHWLYFTHPDSANATVIEEYDKGRFIKRTDFVNKKVTYKDGRREQMEENAAKDTGTVSTQKEASFSKGLTGWRKYLEKNLKTPNRFAQIVKGNGKATVIVAFMVDTAGNTRDIYLYQSVEWSVDAEAQRVIKQGPKWEPATQNGKPVNFTQRQSITFVVTSE